MCLVVLLVCLSVTLHLNDATSCTAITGRTCKKSRFVTGACSNDVCACVDGYEPSRTGCVEKLKLIVGIIAIDASDPNIANQGSGEVLTGGQISLNCLPNNTDYKYVWIKDLAELAGQTTTTLALTNVSVRHSGQYRCKIKVDSNDYVSDISDPVTVKVITENGRFEIRPVVTGMYNRSLENGLISLRCTNVPSGVSLSYEWYVGAALTKNTTSEYTLVMTNETVSTNVTCMIGIMSPSANATLTSPESVPVTTPSSLTDHITGVYIIEARGRSTAYLETSQYFNLRCRIVDTDLAIDTAAYNWTKNGVYAGQNDTFRKETSAPADAGVYKCLVKVGTRPVKETPSLTLIVDDTFVGNVKVVVEPKTALIGGYVSFECSAQVRNISSVDFVWTTNGVRIDRQKDNQIQINGMRAADASKYTCYASTDLVTIQSDDFYLTAPISIDSVAPGAPSSDKPSKDAFDVGNTYTLTCSTAYETPGMTYKWIEGVQIIPGATSKTYSLTAKPGTTLYTCLSVFNGVSSKSSQPTTVDDKKPVWSCTNATDCQGSQNRLSCVNNRCECADVYLAKADSCSQSGVTTIVASILLVTCALILPWI